MLELIVQNKRVVMLNSLPSSDVNECSNGNGGCYQTCTNNAGSYTCSCGSGYTKSGFYGCSGKINCVLLVVVLLFCYLVCLYVITVMAADGGNYTVLPSLVSNPHPPQAKNRMRSMRSYEIHTRIHQIQT